MKTFKIIIAVLVVLFLVWMLWGWLTVRNIETPKYTVTEETSAYEIREYEPMIIAKATVTGNRSQATNRAFGLIADYIFGNNTIQEPIAMTAPVTTEEEPESEPIAMTAPVTSEEDANGEFTTAFVMPSKYTMENIPLPVNDRVILEEVPAKTMAVHTFSGYVWDRKIESKKNKLFEALERDGINFDPNSTLSQYNPPWTPWFMRRNEIWVEVIAEDKTEIESSKTDEESEANLQE